jgi:hypothetical protein
MYANEIRARLNLLRLERVEAASVGLDQCEAYMRDLEEEISKCREALVGATITEIAVARAELYGRLAG